MSLDLHDPSDEELNQLSRVDRTLDESPAIYPHWRWMQARIYQKEFERNPSFDPVDEEDMDVINLYAYLAFGSTDDKEIDKSIRYAIRAVRGNRVFSSSSRMKAMIAAGLSVSQIANRMGCSTLSCQTFEKIFFDVRRYSTFDDYLASIYFSTETPKGDDNGFRNQRLWLAVGSMFGPDQLDKTMNRKVGFTSEGVSRVIDYLKAISLNNALEFSVSRYARGASTADDFDRSMTLLQSLNDERDTDNENNVISFSGGFVSLLETNLGNKIDTNSARHIPEPEKDVRLMLNSMGIDIDKIIVNNKTSSRPSVVIEDICPSTMECSGAKTIKAIELQT